MSMIMTVLGPVAPQDLGITDFHEHLLCRPPDPHYASDPDLAVDDIGRSAEELGLFARSGGRALVEFSTRDYGRDLAGLKRLSRWTGVHIVAATGYQKAKYCTPYLEDRGVDDIVQEIVDELRQGGEEGIRPGVVKAGTSREEVTPAEEKALRAAARAHLETGVPIVTHTEAGTVADRQLDVIEDEGAPASAVALGHLDRKLDLAYHLELADRGAFLGYDQISKEKYHPDGKRIEFLQALWERGHGEQLVLAGDFGRKTYLTSYGGGPGLTYLLWRFVPWLRQTGFSEEQVDAMLVRNPASALTWRGGGDA